MKIPPHLRWFSNTVFLLFIECFLLSMLLRDRFWMIILEEMKQMKVGCFSDWLSYSSGNFQP